MEGRVIEPRGTVHLLEREVEQEVLGDAIAAAQRGRGSMVLIEGPPGIGKTALLREAQELAAVDTLTFLGARGGVLERDYPYGVARQLLAGTISGDAREAIFADAAAQAPALGEAEPALLDALHMVLVSAAEDGPLVLAVDDAHWADAGSLRFLSYLAGRLERLPVALVVACRPREPGASHELLLVLATAAGEKVLEPSPLSSSAVAAMLGAARQAPNLELVQACRLTTGGNPFLVRELLRSLESEAEVPPELTAERLADLAPERVSRSVLSRLTALSPDANRIAAALAVLGGRAELRVVAKLVAQPEPEVAQLADLLADADVLTAGRPLEFQHALVRTAIYRELAPSEREEAHARAARVLAGFDPPDLDAIAAHLLQIEPRGERWAIEWLQRAGGSALERAAPDAAVSYLRRARAEQPPADMRAGVLLALGTAETLAGYSEESIETLNAALEHTDDVALRTFNARLLYGALMRAQRAGEALTVLERAISELPDSERELGLQLEAELRVVTTSSAEAACIARDRFPRFTAVPQDIPRTRGERFSLAAKAIDEMLWGTAARAAELAERALGNGAWLELEGADSPSYCSTVAILFGSGHLARAERALTDGIAEAEARRSVFGVALCRCFRAEARQRQGKLEEAKQDALAALDARRLGLRFGIKICLGALLAVLVEQGELDAAQRVLEEHGFDGPLPDAMTTEYLQFARARLRLERGDLTGALADYVSCEQRAADEGRTHPVVPCWPDSAAVALATLGRADEAQACAAARLKDAREFGSAPELGVSLIVAGGVGGDIDLLAEAVDVLADSEARVFQARALLEHGAALRRAGCRSDAREPLQGALRLARGCGAIALAERAHEELSATGARSRKILRAGAESLTASERRVASLAAAGMSNRDIAAALVVSKRTVETHLGHIYQKLEITSRRQLSNALPGIFPKAPH